MNNQQILTTQEKIKYIKECTAILQDLWTVLCLEDTAPTNRQLAVWLADHKYADIESAFYVALKWLNRQSEPDSITPDNKIKYVSGILNNSQIDAMTPEQKEQRLSDIRSLAGKQGARQKWQNAKTAVCHNLSSVCHSCHLLPCVCQSGSGFASDFDSSSGCDGVTTTDFSSAATPLNNPPLNQEGSQGQSQDPLAVSNINAIEAKQVAKAAKPVGKVDPRDGKRNPNTNGMAQPPIPPRPPRLVANNLGADCEYCFGRHGQPHHKNCSVLRGRS